MLITTIKNKVSKNNQRVNFTVFHDNQNFAVVRTDEGFDVFHFESGQFVSSSQSIFRVKERTEKYWDFHKQRCAENNTPNFFLSSEKINDVSQIGKLVHQKKASFEVNIGRPSKWGNPYSHLENSIAKYKVSNVEEAVQKHREWFFYGEGKHLWNDLHELDGKVMGCWCNTDFSACHGENYLEALRMWRNGERPN